MKSEYAIFARTFSNHVYNSADFVDFLDHFAFAADTGTRKLLSDTNLQTHNIVHDWSLLHRILSALDMDP